VVVPPLPPGQVVAPPLLRINPIFHTPSVGLGPAPRTLSPIKFVDDDTLHGGRVAPFRWKYIHATLSTTLHFTVEEQPVRTLVAGVSDGSL